MWILRWTGRIPNCLICWWLSRLCWHRWLSGSDWGSTTSWRGQAGQADEVLGAHTGDRRCRSAGRLCSIWYPELPGNGKSILTISLNSGMTLGAAAALLFLKPLLTAVFLRAGAVGGMLTPSLATGAAMGSVVAMAINSWTEHDVSVPAVSLTCAAGVLAITQRAPIWAAIFVWELARPPWWLLVVFLGAGSSGTRCGMLSGGCEAARDEHSTIARYSGLLTHMPASPTMPMGTAPDRLTFCTLGPAATIVVSCRIGKTMDMFQSRGSIASITSSIFSVPSKGRIDLRLNAAIADTGDVAGRLNQRVRIRRGTRVVGVAVVDRRGDGFGVVAGDGEGDVGGRPGGRESTPLSPRVRDSHSATPARWRGRRRLDASRRSRPPGCWSARRRRAQPDPVPSTEPSMPTLRNWSAAVLATATDVGSLAATPMTSVNGTPSLVIRPRLSSGRGVPGVGGGGVSIGTS